MFDKYKTKSPDLQYLRWLRWSIKNWHRLVRRSEGLGNTDDAEYFRGKVRDFQKEIKWRYKIS